MAQLLRRKNIMAEYTLKSINDDKEIKEAIQRAEEDREMLGQYYQFIPSIN